MAGGGLTRFFAICVAGACGVGARYLLSGALANLWGARFPYGTLTVNLLGSFTIGLVMHVGLETSLFSPTVRTAVAVGLLGGFTTYSTFSYETVELMRGGAFGLAMINFAVTGFGCLAACWLGLVGGKLFTG